MYAFKLMSMANSSRFSPRFSASSLLLRWLPPPSWTPNCEEAHTHHLFLLKKLKKEKKEYIRVTKKKQRCSDSRIIIAPSPKDAEAEDVEAQMLFFFWNRILPTPGFRLVGKRRNAPAAANPVRKQTKWTNSCLYAQSTGLQPCGASGMSALSMLPCEDCKTYHLKKQNRKTKKKPNCFFLTGF